METVGSSLFIELLSGMIIYFRLPYTNWSHNQAPWSVAEMSLGVLDFQLVVELALNGDWFDEMIRPNHTMDLVRFTHRIN